MKKLNQRYQSFLDKKNLVHISHTDLDGYGCQLVTSWKREKLSDAETIYLNSDYGKEIKVRLLEAFELLKNKEDAGILITDLNLTKELVLFLEQNKSDNIDVLILDHHQWDNDSLNRDYIFVDKTRCATKIAYDEILPNEFKNETLNRIINIVNNSDIFVNIDSDEFKLGRYCANLVKDYNAKYSNMFGDAKTRIILQLLVAFFNLVNDVNIKNLKLNDAISYIDDKINSVFKIRLNFLKEDKIKTVFDIADNLKISVIKKMLKENRDLLYMQNNIMFLRFSISSDLAHKILYDKELDTDIVIYTNERGGIGIRVSTNCSINGADIAKVFNKDGGGHPKAAGAYFKPNIGDNAMFNSTLEPIHNEFIDKLNLVKEL